MDHRIFDDPRPDRNDDSRTVTLTGRDMRDLSRLLQKILDAQEDHTPTSPDYVRHRSRKAFVELARQMLQHRRSRTQQFGSAMFGEPGWEMLLILYSEEDVSRLSVSRLVTASGSPPTTGLRWFEYLESQQLVHRQKHPTDRRIDLVELTDKGRSAMDSYFSETLTKEA
jgi:DNA-binding MarR family transcriptional regulator